MYRAFPKSFLRTHNTKTHDNVTFTTLLFLFQAVLLQAHKFKERIILRLIENIIVTGKIQKSSPLPSSSATPPLQGEVQEAAGLGLLGQQMLAAPSEWGSHGASTASIRLV